LWNLKTWAALTGNPKHINSVLWNDNSEEVYKNSLTPVIGLYLTDVFSLKWNVLKLGIKTALTRSWVSFLILSLVRVILVRGVHYSTKGRLRFFRLITVNRHFFIDKCIIIIIIFITWFFVCLLLCIKVFLLKCLPVIWLWFYVVIVHNVITFVYTVLCL
jgi:hypothetical protein